MPIIFTEQDKENLRKRLFKVGFERIKKYGFKKTRIDEIASDAGIAKGTFYNFFESKEQFFFKMMKFNRDNNRKKAEKFFLHGNPTRENTREFFLKKYLEGDISVAYIERDDLALIFRKNPNSLEEVKTEALDFMDKIFDSIKDKSPNAERDVIVNMMNIIADYVANKERYFENTFETTVTILVDSMVNYIFEA
tara:strand:+ start:100 stop:681 length:582 start_codon:yes stop_codon:yes gene_type:complete